MADNQNNQSQSSQKSNLPDPQKQANTAKKKRRKKRPQKKKSSKGNQQTSKQVGDPGSFKKKKKKAVKKGGAINATPISNKPPQPKSQKASNGDNADLNIEPLGNKPLSNQKQSTSKQSEETQGFDLGADPNPVADASPDPTSGTSSDPFPKQFGSNSTEWDQLKNEIKKDHVKTEQELKGKKAEEKTPDPETSAAKGGAIGAAATVSEELSSDKDDAEQSKEEKEDVKKKKNPELKPGEGEVIPPPDLPEDDLEKKEVLGIIMRYALGGCLVIALISGIFFFNVPGRIYSGITGLFGGKEEVIEEQVPTEKESEEEASGRDTTKELESTFVAGENQGTSRDKFEEGIETALLTGDEKQIYTGAPDAIKTLFLTGLEMTSSVYIDRIGSYMGVLLQLQNAFSTDIHQLLDNSSDRGKALQVHLIDLEDIYQESMETYRTINEEKDSIKVQFNSVTTQKEQIEKDFFVSLEKLEGNKSNDLLNSFIEVSKRQVELKAHYNSLNKVSTLFDTALANTDARIKDMKLNREALIEGVKVVDIKGSDLDLIIEESDLF